LSGPADPSGSATFYARLEGFRQAWQWIQVSPLFGHGFDQASAITATGGDLIHNTLIATWFGGGVLALIGIVCVLLSAAGTARSAWANAKSSESRRLAAALFAAVGSAITFSMANPILFQRYVWVPIFLAIALASDQSRTSIPARRVEVAAGGGAERARMSARLSA
jgi:O-antigen ligase